MKNSASKQLLVLTLFLNSLGLSAVSQPVVSYLGIEHGLSNNEVNCIYQSNEGYMWFGTFDGLNRFDGYGFKIFRKKIGDQYSLINNRIQDITEDAEGNLWIATMGGVSVYAPLLDKFTTLKYRQLDSSSIKLRSNVNHVKRYSNNDMLVGTTEEGLLVRRHNNTHAEQIPLRDGNTQTTAYNVSSMDVDLEQRVWLFVDGVGLCRYIPGEQLVRLVSDELKRSVCLKADSLGNLWIGTTSGVYQYNVAKNSYLFKPLEQAVTNLYFDRQGKLWLCTDGGGVFFLDVSNGDTMNPPPYANNGLFTSMSIKGVWQDEEGRFWVATLRGGINFIDTRKHLFKTYTPGFQKGEHYDNHFISSFCEDRSGNIWIGSDGNGLSFWNRKTGKFTDIRKDGKEKLNNNHITSVLQDHDNNIWVATWGGGINRYNHVTRRFDYVSCINAQNLQASLNIWALYEDSFGNLWASSYGDGGLFKFNPANNRFELFDGTIGNVLIMKEDGKHFWVGTDDRLIRIDTAAKRHLVFEIGYRVRDIEKQTDGIFWIATEGAGLIRFDTRTGKYLSYTENDGLPSNSILKILRSNNSDLWLSTFGGLSVFDPETKHFTNFSVSDGLQSNQFSYSAALRLKSGELVFGGIKGFNLFFPHEINPSRDIQLVRLSAIKINNTPLSDSVHFFQYAREVMGNTVGRLLLPFDKTSLSFDYVALDYSTPDKVDYAYFLEGWDKDWTYAGKIRTANYSRLDEGHYTLRLKATNSEGEWGNETQIRIQVLPPWYRTVLAYILYVTLLCTAFFVYTGYKRRQTELAYEIRLAQMATQQEKELNAKKLSFFTNIAHELRTPLTLIVNPVNELLAKAEFVFKNDLSIIQRNASRLLSLVDQLLLFRTVDDETSPMQIQRLNISDLCKYTFESFSQLAVSKNICCTFECTCGPIEILGDAQKLEIVFFNLISNAFKFTPPGGTIKLVVKDTEEHIHILIADTGCGINEELKDKLFEKYHRGKNGGEGAQAGFGIGLYLVKRLIDCHEGTLDCSTAPGKGTCFQIRLRKGNWCDIPVNETAINNAAVATPLELLEGNLNVGPDIEPLEITERKSILIVDDNLDIRQYLKKSFARRYVVYEAGNGVEGFELARRHVPNVVISDVLMGEMDGLVLCTKIKNDPELNHIPVVLLSGLNSADRKLQGIESGATDYITKPFDCELLIAKINSILDDGSALLRYFRDSITLKQNNQKISASYKVFLQNCITIIETNIDNAGLNPQMLAELSNMSYPTLYKKVKSVSGLTVNAFIRSIRLRKAALIILTTDTNVNEAAFQVGIHDLKYFRQQFKNLYGMNPSEYIKKYRHSFNKEFNLCVKSSAS